MGNLDLRDNIPPKEEPVFPARTRRILRSPVFWISIIIAIVYLLLR